MSQSNSLFPWRAAAVGCSALAVASFLGYRCFISAKAVEGKKKPKKLRFVRLLQNTETTKPAIALAVSDEGESQQAIAIVARKPFSEIQISHILEQKGDFRFQLAHENAEYSKCFVRVPNEEMLVDFICPADASLIKRYSSGSSFFLLRETPLLYRQVTVPFVSALPASFHQWIWNIFDHTSEADTILVETPEFVFLPNPKWVDTKRNRRAKLPRYL